MASRFTITFLIALLLIQMLSVQSTSLRVVRKSGQGNALVHQDFLLADKTVEAAAAAVPVSILAKNYGNDYKDKSKNNYDSRKKMKSMKKSSVHDHRIVAVPTYEHKVVQTYRHEIVTSSTYESFADTYYQSKDWPKTYEQRKEDCYSHHDKKRHDMKMKKNYTKDQHQHYHLPATQYYCNSKHEEATKSCAIESCKSNQNNMHVLFIVIFSDA